MTSAAELVTLTIWGVSAQRVPAALGRVALDRWRLSRVPGLTFAKVLGTGRGATFTLRDADLRHWALLVAWEDADAAEQFLSSEIRRGWERISNERLEVRMLPIASRGCWSGRKPFGDPQPRPVDGPVAAITRARIRLARAQAFRRAAPPVAIDLDDSPGLLLRIGLGEAPAIYQGTFSIWESTDAMTRFAHRRPAHAEVIRRTNTEGWYAEELFARFALQAVTGTLQGRQINIADPQR